MDNNRLDGFYLARLHGHKSIRWLLPGTARRKSRRTWTPRSCAWWLKTRARATRRTSSGLSRYIYIYIYIYIHPAHTLVSTLNLRYPHGGVRPFHQKSTCLTQLTLGPYVVQIWSRNTPESGANETLVLHRVGGWAGEANKVVPPSPFAASLSPSPQVVSRYPLEPPLLAFLLGTDPHRNSWSGFTTPSEVALQNHLEWLYKTICQWPVPSRACRGSLPD